MEEGGRKAEKLKIIPLNTNIRFEKTGGQKRHLSVLVTFYCYDKHYDQKQCMNEFTLAYGSRGRVHNGQR